MNPVAPAALTFPGVAGGEHRPGVTWEFEKRFAGSVQKPALFQAASPLLLARASARRFPVRPKPVFSPLPHYCQIEKHAEKQSEAVDFWHMTKSQKAMAMAMLFPETEQGKRTDLTGSKNEQVHKGYLSMARTVLNTLPETARNVLGGTPSRPRPRREDWRWLAS
jgi:hypothetical protein